MPSPLITSTITRLASVRARYARGAESVRLVDPVLVGGAADRDDRGAAQQQALAHAPEDPLAALVAAGRS